VRAQLVDSPEAKDALLKKLIADHEPAYAQQWQDLPQEYTQKMLTGIVGLELEVLEWTCKLKVNQHRPESHRRMREIYAAGNEDERELAAWMERLGLGGA
jgi:transcriptional regulator